MRFKAIPEIFVSDSIIVWNFKKKISETTNPNDLLHSTNGECNIVQMVKAKSSIKDASFETQTKMAAMDQRCMNNRLSEVFIQSHIGNLTVDLQRNIRQFNIF